MTSLLSAYFLSSLTLASFFSSYLHPFLPIFLSSFISIFFLSLNIFNFIFSHSILLYALISLQVMFRSMAHMIAFAELFNSRRREARLSGTHGLPYESVNIMWADILRIHSKLSEVNHWLPLPLPLLLLLLQKKMSISKSMIFSLPLFLPFFLTHSHSLSLFLSLSFSHSLSLSLSFSHSLTLSTLPLSFFNDA